ncbi:MAG: tRNA lysidine(34) synthetase TilS [Acidimicrobiia bacterium]
MAGSGRLKELAEAVRERAGPHLPSGPRLVALSGGADSAVCAWVAGETGETRAVFVDHGLPASPLMAGAAREVARFLEMELTEVAVSLDEGPSPEGRAREARYRALHNALHPEEWLLVGHTFDDQAETVLANLLRGAGPEGLAGMPVRRDRLLRPLLGVTRAETRELASLLGIPYRDDPANLASEPRRNALRREVIPALEARYNPALRRVLVRTAGLLAADQQLLESRAAAVPISRQGPVVSLPAPLLGTLPGPVAARAVRKALRMARGPHAGSAAEVEMVLEVARGERSAATLAGAVAVKREGPWVVLRAGPETAPEPVALALPGEATYGRWHLEAWLETSPPSAWPLSAWTVVLDADLVGPRVRVRPAREGGRIALPKGHKAVADALGEASVPPRLRSGWPVVEKEGEILWLPGVRTAPFGWVGAGTTRYLWASATRA